MLTRPWYFSDVPECSTVNCAGERTVQIRSAGARGSKLHRNIRYLIRRTEVASSCVIYMKGDGKEVLSGNYSEGPGKWLDD
jgi:hypothetical protein